MIAKAVPALVLACAAGSAFAGPDTIDFVYWDFNNLAPNTIINNPPPSKGVGLAKPLGMTNNYKYDTSPIRTGSFTACDVALSSGSPGEPVSPTNFCWRVRGSFDGTLAGAGIGWGNQAPEFTQGAEFNVSTVNYTNIIFKFDLFSTNQGVRNGRLQYSIDAGNTWISTGPTVTVATNNWVNNLTYNFTGVAGVANNPDFRVRFVSVYGTPPLTRPPTSVIYGGAANPGPAYTSAQGVNTPYNNFSGNWRFDRVTFTGDAIAPTNPAVNASVTPTAVCGSTGGAITITANVTGGAKPFSTGLGVTANLTSLGLAANTPLFDDGNPANGDSVAGDGIFSAVVNVPAGRPLGSASFTTTVTDAQGRSASNDPTQNPLAIAVADCSTNSAARVVISQTFGGGGRTGATLAEDAPYSADYVELFNRSNQVVSLDGWSVQYASPRSAGGFLTADDRVLLSGTIQPGQYVLVRMSDPVAGFQDLPTPDFAQVPGAGGMGNLGGRVALVRSPNLLGTNFTSSSIEDLVGYGNGFTTGALTFEGAAPTVTPNPSSNTAILRVNAGAQDTNQNFNDFAPGFPNPRNRTVGGFLATYPASNASVVCAGSQVTLSANVNRPNGSSGIRVFADVSSIAPGAQPVELFDNGNPANGDAAAGDLIFSAIYTVPAAATQGAYTLSFTTTDAQNRSNTTTLPLSVGSCSTSNAPVVISRVYGGGGNAASGFNADFAEIFNRSNLPVDLTGWSFQSARVTDAGFDSRIVNLTGVINPGEYRLIITNAVSTTGASTGTPDFVPTLTFGMESSSGRVALVRSTNLIGTDFNRSDIVDTVGYGTNCPTFEGVAPVPNLSDVLVAVRKDNGCRDTNQNALDFDVILATTAPRNSASPANPCNLTFCSIDYNQDTFVNLDDLGDFITDFYTLPPIPAGLQPNAPTYPDITPGSAFPCPNAPDAPAPYSTNAYRVNGYRVGFSPDTLNACPLSPDQAFPNLDNLGDFISAYYAGAC
jgi:hypothetical protein